MQCGQNPQCTKTQIQVFGFVKCVFKLMDGWEKDLQGDDTGAEFPERFSKSLSSIPRGLSACLHKVCRYMYTCICMYMYMHIYIDIIFSEYQDRRIRRSRLWTVGCRREAQRGVWQARQEAVLADNTNKESKDQIQ